MNLVLGLGIDLGFAGFISMSSLRTFLLVLMKAGVKARFLLLGFELKVGVREVVVEIYTE